VTAIQTGLGNGTKIRNWCENTAGLTLGIGLRMVKDTSLEQNDYFRIGHMGHLNVPMIMGTLGTIDSALKALDIPHENGALEAAAQVISEV
jgi:alanine-glyoxylate transaminase/serine-glyoxylate transaminase/serine-pyruvate transaminase